MMCVKCIHSVVCQDYDKESWGEKQHCKRFKDNGWIPVSERLPIDTLNMRGLKQVKVLVSTKQGVVKTCLFRWEKDYNGNFTGWRFTVYDVVAWMPLPEPYQTDLTI